MTLIRKKPMNAESANLAATSLAPLSAGASLRKTVRNGWNRLDAWLRAKSKGHLYLIITSVSLVVGWFDWVTDYEVNFSLVYALLVVVTAWVGGRNVALCVAVTNVMISAAANWTTQPSKSTFGYALSTINRTTFWSFMAICTSLIRKRQDSDAERIQILEEMRQLELEIVSVSEQEQQRIGQDLHDGLCQQLAAMGCAARALADDLRSADRPEAEDAVKIEQALQEAVQDARGLARGIFPVHVDRIGLSAALVEMAQATQRLTGVPIHMTDSSEVQVDDPEIAMHLFRIAQEAVANAVKHSGAREVILSLLPDNDHLELRVDDNGRGLPARTQASSSGMGLRTMRYRAHALGAELAIEPRAGGGTSLWCRLKVRTNYAPDTHALK